MKILLNISDADLSPAAVRALGLARRLKADGHEVLIVLRQSILANEPPAAAAEADAAGITHAVIRQRMRFDPGLLGQMELIMGRFSPDVYVSHDLIGMSFHRMARWRPKRWAVLYSGLWPKSGLIGAFLRRTERRTLRQADVLFASDEAGAEALRGWKIAAGKIALLTDETVDDAARRIVIEGASGAAGTPVAR